MEKQEERLIAFCPLCKWQSVSGGNKFKSFKRKNIQASEILYDKLYSHFEEEHIDLIMEVWMNNQASRSIIGFDKKDIKCKGCRDILARCFCFNPQEVKPNSSQH